MEADFYNCALEDCCPPPCLCQMPIGGHHEKTWSRSSSSPQRSKVKSKLAKVSEKRLQQK